MNRLDTLIGELLDALKRSGKAENTLIVYLGNHGADLPSTSGNDNANRAASRIAGAPMMQPKIRMARVTFPSL